MKKSMVGTLFVMSVLGGCASGPRISPASTTRDKVPSVVQIQAELDKTIADQKSEFCNRTTDYGAPALRCNFYLKSGESIELPPKVYDMWYGPIQRIEGSYRSIPTMYGVHCSDWSVRAFDEATRIVRCSPVSLR